ncbi:MAG: hypothetical protein JW751_04800 [Polyangiaceae bacterium]|nr:hypothetical protein [Polyangiaceae bacterium]
MERAEAGVVLFGVVEPVPRLHREYLVFILAGPLGLLLPYFSRELPVNHDAPKVLVRYGGPAIVVSLGLLREQIKGAIPLIQAGIVFLVAAFISSYFWLMSDRRIVVVKR